MSALVMGTVNDRTDASVHIRTVASTCRVITRLAEDGKRVQRRQIVKANGPVKASRVCRWCATPENLAAAHTDNVTGTNWSAAVEKVLAALGPQVTVADILNRPGHAEEVAEIEARHAEFWAETSVEVVPEPTRFVRAAVNAGYVPQPKRKGRPATRRNANIHNLFSVKAA